MPLRLTLVAILGAFVAVGCATRPLPTPEPTYADKVIVEKSARRLRLMNNGDAFREYRVSLGGNPIGHKVREGDQRTPEGDYLLNWRNPNSRFHKSIHISYPNQQDIQFARYLGHNPGGLIMIHGLPNHIVSEQVRREYIGRDWTDGCIAVTNEEMDEIWNLVRDGTPIRILP
ncbi:L,D-transpeptidase family protein [Thioalkalicoccus limnaeus]|uniref:L,D-transpeptidase family protein n=1 Tax=Thioalkalicoccus limnaeus TaxID=120681 RepID=A0ABV4BD90_9GAMM